VHYIILCHVMWCDVMWCDVMWCDVMWLLHITSHHITSHVWHVQHASFLCDMTGMRDVMVHYIRSCVMWCDSFMCDMTRFSICDVTRSYVPWLVCGRHDVNASCLPQTSHGTYERVMSRECVMSTTNESWCVCREWDAECYGALVRVLCDVQRLIDVRHDSFICSMTYLCATWHINVWHVGCYGALDRVLCDVQWLIFSCVTWLIHMYHDTLMCDMTHQRVTCGML